MNEGASNLESVPVSPTPIKSSKHKWFWSVTLFFITCGVIFVIYWFGWGQYREGTNDAYVNGNMIMMMPLEQGIITTIFADNAQRVDAGQPLIELDRHDFEIALDKAKADLANAVRQVTQMFLKVDQLKAKKEVNRANLIRASLDYEHRKALVEDASVSREEFEHSETTLLASWAALTEVGKELEASIAEVENTTISTHPLVEQAKSVLRKRFLALHRCTVLAPVRGIVTQRKAQVGQWARADEPLMALVPLDEIWVDANLREVSLKNLRIGQPVELFSDMYGREVKFHGRIVGLNPGTGSVFSILPPQNATGNWIKIIQRIPVKVSLNAAELEEHPLVLGLSMTVTVDTRNRNGLQLPAATSVRPIYTTNIYEDELEGADTLIESIITDNSFEMNADPQTPLSQSREIKDDVFSVFP